MNNIPPYFLPILWSKVRGSKNFLFEFQISYRSYGYLLKLQKLKLFPTTLKDRALKWFMSLGTNSIRSWNDMQKIFLEKYKDHDLKEEIFRMNQK